MSKKSPTIYIVQSVKDSKEVHIVRGAPSPKAAIDFVSRRPYRAFAAKPDDIIEVLRLGVEVKEYRGPETLPLPFEPED